MQCRFQSAIDGKILEGTKFVQSDRRFQILGYNVIDERNYQYYFTLSLEQ
jgi:hypothetical protein